MIMNPMCDNLPSIKSAFELFEIFLGSQTIIDDQFGLVTSMLECFFFKLSALLKNVSNSAHLIVFFAPVFSSMTHNRLSSG